MKLYLTILLILFCELLSIGSIAQNKYTLPQITPQSPNVASLGKYGDIPVSLSNGVANISVPLFGIKVGSFELPISLSYHNNGLKVDDIPSWVGLGWDLAPAGTISVEQRGNDDFSIDGVGMFTSTTINPSSRDSLNKFLRNQMSSQDQYNYLESVMRGDVDAEYDLFHYNFLGYSGSFYFDSSQAIVCIPKSNLKIYWLNGTFEFLDEKGNQYYFAQTEFNQMSPSPEGSVATRKSFSDNASYLLTGIITSENRMINFGYHDYPFSYQKRSWFISHYASQPFPECPTTSTNTSLTNFNLQNSLLAAITFDEGSILFDVSDSARKDILNINSNLGVPYLKQIRFLDKNNKLIDEFVLSCSYFGNNARLRLDSISRTGIASTAEKWKFGYYNPDAVPGFFGYSKDHWGYYNGTNSTNSIPVAGYDSLVPMWNPDLPAMANRSSNFNYALSAVLSSITYPTGGQSLLQYEPNQVKFQNGGQLAANPFLQFNLNDYGHYRDLVLVNTDSGSSITGSFTLTGTQTLLILAKKTIDPLSFIQSSVSLSTSINGTNILNSLLTYNCAFTNCIAEQNIVLTPGTYYYDIEKNLQSGDNPTGGYAYLDIAAFVYDSAATVAYPVGGCRIASIQNTNGLGNTLKKKYIYSDRIDSVTFRNIPYYLIVNRIRKDRPLNQGAQLCVDCNPEYRIQDESVIPMSGNPVEYKYVTELTDDNGSNGRIDYVFTGSDNLTAEAGRPYLPPFVSTWRAGLSAGKKFYKRTGSNYVLIKQDTSVYEFTYPPNSVTNGIRAEYWIYCDEQGPDHREIITNTENYQTEQFDQKSATETLLDNSGNISSAITYSYLSSIHTLPTEISRTDSKNETVREKTIYSADYDTTHCMDSASLGIRNLKSKNIIVPVEKITIKTINGSDYILSGTLITYKIKATVPDRVYQLNIRAPVLLSAFALGNISSGGVFTKDTRYEERASFDAYDSFNNVLQQHYTNNTFVSYLWDYRNLHLICETTNAIPQDIAYTSFEADGSGNWTIPSVLRDTTNAITGSRSYVLNNGSIGKSGLAAGNTYMVSYWSKNGSYAVTGSTGVITGKTVNGWTYYEHTITNAGSITVSGSGNIDELRLYPKNAQMTTYAYRPLVGVTNVCDINNRITYYEYDEFERLKLMRDQDRNILKTFKYQYQEQQ